MYCLFCVVLRIVCVIMCAEQLPRGGYPITVKYIISYNYHITARGCRFLTEFMSCFSVSSPSLRLREYTEPSLETVCLDLETT